MKVKSYRLPDFLIIGTQKAGTTWLMKKIGLHPKVFMASRQLHFFDRNFHLGLDWYSSKFVKAKSDQIVGEKTTEYFDTNTISSVAERISATLPDSKLIVILRNPVDRAWSAMIHHVNSGLIKLPFNPDSAVFDNIGEKDGLETDFRFIERGFYADQLNILYEKIDRSRVLVLIFEDDIVVNPKIGWSKVCRFLDLEITDIENSRLPENRVQLSVLACHVSYYVKAIPYARGLVKRLDRLLGLKKWAPSMSTKTRIDLENIYSKRNCELFKILGHKIHSWEIKK